MPLAYFICNFSYQVRHKKKAETEKKAKEFAERDKRQKLNKLTVIEEREIDAENKKYEQFIKATEQLFQIIDTTLLKCYLQVCISVIT